MLPLRDYIKKLQINDPAIVFIDLSGGGLTLDQLEELAAAINSNTYAALISWGQLPSGKEAEEAKQQIEQRLQQNNNEFYWRMESVYSLAERGNVGAQFNLGWRYAKGQGVTQNYQEAVMWLRKAAERNQAGAQFYLGFMYQDGKGVTQNKREAVMWLRKAAEQNHASAQFNLGVMYEKGKGITQDTQEAVKWYRKAAEQNHASAQFNLGLMYQYGKGVAQDYRQASEWYAKAAKNGDTDALKKLDKLFHEGKIKSQPIALYQELQSLPAGFQIAVKHLLDKSNAANVEKGVRQLKQVENGLNPLALLQGNNPEALISLNSSKQVIQEIQRTLSTYFQPILKQFDELSQQGEMDEALQRLEQIPSLHPQYAHISLAKGKLYAEKGDYAKAIPAFKEASKLKPDVSPHARQNLAEAHAAWGKILQQQQQYSQAFGHLQQALILSATQMPLWRAAYNDCAKKSGLISEQRDWQECRLAAAKAGTSYNPTHYEYALLSYEAYNGYLDHDRANPEQIKPPFGWDVLTTAEQQGLAMAGYFGIAFVQRAQRHIVIAHRGTEFSTPDFLTDANLVFNSIDEPHIQHALEFAKRLQTYAELEQYTISYTGHSLGGALAQLSAGFYQVPAVTFDAPGANHLLELLLCKDKKSCDGLKDAAAYNHVNYVSAPNPVNTLNQHLGRLVRLYPETMPAADIKIPAFVSWVLRRITNSVLPPNFPVDQALTKSLEYGQYVAAQHSMTGLLGCFHPVTGQPVKALPMLKWPEGMDKAVRFYNLCNELNIKTYEPTAIKLEDMQRLSLNKLDYVASPITKSELSWNTLTVDEQSYLNEVKSKDLCLKQLSINEKQIDLKGYLATEEFKAYLAVGMQNQQVKVDTLGQQSSFFGISLAQAAELPSWHTPSAIIKELVQVNEQDFSDKVEPFNSSFDAMAWQLMTNVVGHLSLLLVIKHLWESWFGKTAVPSYADTLTQEQARLSGNPFASLYYDHLAKLDAKLDEAEEVQAALAQAGNKAVGQLQHLPHLIAKDSEAWAELPVDMQAALQGWSEAVEAHASNCQTARTAQHRVVELTTRQAQQRTICPRNVGFWQPATSRIAKGNVAMLEMNEPMALPRIGQ